MQQKPETPGIQLKTEGNKIRHTAPLGKLRIIPLGGLGEVGMNMTVYEYGNDMIVIDAGGLFPKEDMPGIDLVIPDIDYILKNRHKLRAILFTHGHEDHISAIPYIYPRLEGVPMYGLPLTAALIESKFEEHNIKTKVNIVKAGDRLKFGEFKVDLFNLPHTIPDNVGMGIYTPEGLIVHATDWKFDHTPVWGDPPDYKKILSMSDEGVKLLLSDSTNAMVPGYAISERVVQMEIEKVFKEKTDGRIIMSSFASNINRLQIAINMSAKYGRKLAVSGRSMDRNIKKALELGYVNAPKDILVDIKRIAKIPPGKLTIMCTGSQGEEYSALVRMASGEHRQVQIKRGDTVLISASRIPGNEGRIHKTVDNLFRLGAFVIQGGEQDMHTSGHAKQEELKMMIAMLKPQYFLPIHGEYRMRKAHAFLAKDVGVEPKNIFVGDNGGTLEIEKGKAKWGARAQANYVMIDGLGIGDVGEIVIRDRQAMAEEGIFTVILTVDKNRGTLLSSPDIISRGFVYMRAAEDLIHKARREIQNLFDRHNKSAPMDWEYVKRAIRDDLGQFLYDYTQRRPMVIPVIIEV
ncbi:ribonuclease J [Candidatus Berkelbacteria bacterium]|nr:ribonuclease J [Candidatus Berkelbacteria bacterium]